MSVSFRRLTENDKPLIDQWIAADADHCAKGMTSEFFSRFFSLAVEDKEGSVLFLALEPKPPAIIVHIQFGVSKGRTAKALLAGFPTVRDQCKQCGAKEMIFDTLNPALARFCEKAWGFARVDQTENWRLPL
jgi:hypothetical protein